MLSFVRLHFALIWQHGAETKNDIQSRRPYAILDIYKVSYR